MNLVDHIVNYWWLYLIIVIIVLLAIAFFFPLGVLGAIAFGSWLWGVSKYMSMVRGELSNKGPYPLEWFDNICFINSINYMFSSIDGFENELTESTGGIKEKRYREMIERLVALLRHINRLSFDPSANREFIKSFKLVCNDPYSVFWRGTLHGESDLGFCAKGFLGSPYVYLDSMLKSSGLDTRYPIKSVCGTDSVFSKIVDNVGDSKYIFVFVCKQGYRIMGLRKEKDIRTIKSFDDLYVIIDGNIYDIVSYCHLYGNPISHALTTRRIYDGKEYRWFKMINRSGKPKDTLEIGLKEIKRNILWRNTFYLLKKRNK